MKHIKRFELKNIIRSHKYNIGDYIKITSEYKENNPSDFEDLEDLDYDEQIFIITDYTDSYDVIDEDKNKYLTDPVDREIDFPIIVGDDDIISSLTEKEVEDLKIKLKAKKYNL